MILFLGPIKETVPSDGIAGWVLAAFVSFVVGGGAVSVYLARSNRRKGDADAELSGATAGKARAEAEQIAITTMQTVVAGLVADKTRRDDQYSALASEHHELMAQFKVLKDDLGAARAEIATLRIARDEFAVPAGAEPMATFPLNKLNTQLENPDGHHIGIHLVPGPDGVHIATGWMRGPIASRPPLEYDPMVESYNDVND